MLCAHNCACCAIETPVIERRRPVAARRTLNGACLPQAAPAAAAASATPTTTMMLGCLRQAQGLGRHLLPRLRAHRLLSSSSSSNEAKPVALSKMKDSFNNGTSGRGGPACACNGPPTPASPPAPRCPPSRAHGPCDMPAMRPRRVVRAVAYLEELERQFAANPASIDKSWATFLRSLGAWGVVGWRAEGCGGLQEAYRRGCGARKMHACPPPAGAATPACSCCCAPLQRAACAARPSRRRTTRSRRRARPWLLLAQQPGAPWRSRSTRPSRSPCA